MLKTRLTLLTLAAAAAISFTVTQASAQGTVGAPGGVSNSTPGNGDGSSAGGTGNLGTTAQPSGRIVLNPQQGQMQSADPAPAATPPRHRATRHHRRARHHRAMAH